MLRRFHAVEEPSGRGFHRWESQRDSPLDAVKKINGRDALARPQPEIQAGRGALSIDVNLRQDRAHDWRKARQSWLPMP